MGKPIRTYQMFRPFQFSGRMTRLAISAVTLASIMPLAAVVVSPELSAPAFAGKSKGTVDPAMQAMKEGEAAMYKHDYETAVDQFKQAIYFSRNQYCPLGWKYLGMAHKALREYPKAVEAYNNHLKQVTEPSIDARCDLASCWAEQGDFEAAKKELDTANREAKGQQDILVLCAMGKLYEKMDDYGTALGNYEAAVQKDKHYTEALMGQARDQVVMGVKFPESQYLNQALKNYLNIIDNRHQILGADFHEVYYNMAQIYWKRGDHQNTIDHLHYALKENPNSYTAHLALGKVFDDEKHISSAITQYESAIANAPRNTDLDKVKSRILFLQAKLKPDEGMAPVKPSPLMRQQQRKVEGPPPKATGSVLDGKDTLPTGPDSGF